MKRRDLLGAITRRVKTVGLVSELQREGAGHSLYQLDGKPVVVPRHREINEHTAVSILRDLEGKLGQRWWK